MFYSKQEIDIELLENMAKRFKGQKDVLSACEEQGRVIFAARDLMYYFLGRDFVVTRFHRENGIDDFYHVRGEQDIEKPRYINRMCDLAHYLYALADTDGFDVLLERIKTRESRAPFFEAMIAAHHRLEGYDVYVMKETGERGRDFDFRAERATASINVEVSEIKLNKFSAKTVANKLRSKRSQVTKDLPASMYIIVPDAWFVENTLKRIHEMKDVTVSFLRNNSRWNYVNYVWNPTIETSRFVVFGIVHNRYLNLNPCNPSPVGEVTVDRPVPILFPNGNSGYAYPGHYSFLGLLRRGGFIPERQSKVMQDIKA
jgi:hypothetical protein